MTKYDTPPVILTSNTEDVDFTAPNAPEAYVQATTARFIVFPQEDTGWVLRDYLAGQDFPFHSRHAVDKGIELRRHRPDLELIGSPLHINAYGEPLESVEVFE